MKTKQISKINTISDGIDAAEMVKNSEFKTGGDIRYYKKDYDGYIRYYNVCNHKPFTKLYNTDIAFLFLYDFGQKRLIDTETYLWAPNTNQL